ncbi:sensor histidine kinase [Gracilibacillus salitolerans]|nr:histidine kinase [Gracilibacillus salitolerans]
MKVFKEPMLYVNIWRFLNIAVLIHLWIILETTINSFILILLLLIMTSLRWRFPLPIWSVLVDAIMCLLFFPSTVIGYYGLALPIFELSLKKKGLFSLLFFAGVFFPSSPSNLLFWYYLQAFFFGTFSSITLENQEIYKLEADEQRRDRYELERIKNNLLEANQSVYQQAEIMERYRISRELHDHLGHDLTGASLALQAYEWIEDPKEAQKLIQEVRNRLERSTKSLRDTVHNMTPITLIGAEILENIVQNYQLVDIDFHKTGNMLLVSAHKWGLLEVCLKETLTNVSRHSNATKVKVDLQVTESIVRLSIQDNGIVKETSHTGSGLRGLRIRARSMGGSLSISQKDGFLVVCVIPIDKERLNT